MKDKIISIICNECCDLVLGERFSDIASQIWLIAKHTWKTQIRGHAGKNQEKGREGGWDNLVYKEWA